MGGLTMVEEISSDSFSAGDWKIITDLKVSQLSEPLIVFIEFSHKPISQYTQLPNQI